MIVHPHNLPKMERRFEAMLVWMDEEPMDPNTQFFIKHNTNSTKARIDAIRYRVDVNTLEKSEVLSLALNEIGRVLITANKPMFFDPYTKNRSTGSFILIDPMTHNTCAVGMILDKVSSDTLPMKITDIDKELIVKGVGLIQPQDYQKKYGQKAATLWITGLHGSGKNEVAYLLQKSLFDAGAQAVVLDGKSIRSGLSRELDYSPADRAEHLRRIAYIAKLLNQQGIITICSFISPTEAIRLQVKEIIGNENFHMVYMDADIEYCRSNDQYDLYQLAEEGKIKYLPGVDTEYQPPKNASITLSPEEKDTAVEKILEYLSEKKIFPL